MSEAGMGLRPLGSSGVAVSELCLGAMNFGNTRIGVDERTSRAVMDAYFEAGGNFVDTADAYSGGVSEEIVGRALAGRRDRVLVATKGYFPVTEAFGDPPAHPNALGSSRRHLMEAVEGSLRRLNTDYLDLYQVHCWDVKTPMEETLATMDGLVRQGKVRYWGVSNWTAWQIAEASATCHWRLQEPFVTAQMQYSLIVRDIEQDVIPACRRHGVGILPWSPLGQGVLTGKYLGGQRPAGARMGGEPANAAAATWRERFMNDRAQGIARLAADIGARTGSTATAVSLAWLLRQPAVSSVIMGPKTVAQLHENLAAAQLSLSSEDVALLDEASAPPPRYPEWFIAGSPRAR